MAPKQTCSATKENGEPCGAPPSFVDPKTGLCWTHSEEGREAAREAARKGGQATARKLRKGGLHDDDLPPLDSPQAAETWLEKVGRSVATGRLTHNEGRTIARLVREWLRAREAGEVADWMEAMEDKLSALQRGNLEAVR